MSLLVTATSLSTIGVVDQPVIHPQGSQAAVNGHNVMVLDQNNMITADQFGILSSDPTGNAGNAIVTAAPVGSVAKLRIAYSGTNVDISYTVQSGDTVATVAQALYNAILANTTLQGWQVLSQYPGNGGAGGVAITHNWNVLPTLSDQSTGGAALSLTQPGSALDAAPVTWMARVVPGRIPQGGDNMGQFFAEGPSVNNPNTISLSYIGHQYTIIDPHDATATGQEDFFARVNGNWMPIFSFSNGIGMWSATGAPPTFMGPGTINLPPGGNYYINGVPIGGGTSTGPRLSVRLQTNQTYTSATLATIGFDTVEADTCSGWNAGTFTYKPNIAGTYTFTIGVRSYGNFTNGDNFDIYFEKNGAVIRQASAPVATGLPGQTAFLSFDVAMNGTTDYVGVAAYLVGSSLGVAGSSNGLTYLSGHWISP